MSRRLPPALRERDFAFLWSAILGMRFAEQMLAVAVGWQVYAIHRNPLDLGLIGLAEFLPLPLLALPGRPARGPAAAQADLGVRARDQRGRRVALCSSVTLEGRAPGCGRSSRSPRARASRARSAGPALRRADARARAGRPAAGRARAPLDRRADRRSSSAPRVGGLIFAARPELVYVAAAGLLRRRRSAAMLAVRRRAAARGVAASRRRGLESLRRRRPLRAPNSRMLLGAIALDLFAVLFGGATALLPVFARSILHVGPVGLGVLRTAPAVGALDRGDHPRATAASARAQAPTSAPSSSAIFGVQHGRVRSSRQWLPLSLVALAISGLRRHGQREPSGRPTVDARDAERDCSGRRQRRRDGVHQRVERAAALSSPVPSPRSIGTVTAGRRRRRRRRSPVAAVVDAPLPVALSHGPPRRICRPSR